MAESGHHDDSDITTDDSQQRLRESQIRAYVDWVNTQLKKRPGTPLVRDLASGMHDGVLLATLTEIIAGESLEGIMAPADSYGIKIHNVETILSFMRHRKIRMHHIEGADVVEGNLKSIMRLILSLAAHYKPNSVKHTAHAQGGAYKTHSMAGIAQGAAAVLANAKRDVSSVVPKPRRPKQLSQQDGYHQSSGTGSDSDHSYGDRYWGHRHLEGASTLGGSPRSSGDVSPRAQRKLDFGVPKSRSQDFQAVHSLEIEKREKQYKAVLDEKDSLLDRIQGDYKSLAVEFEATKQAVIQLQDLLLSGKLPEDAESEALPVKARTADEEVVILRSRLAQLEMTNQDQKYELSKIKNENMHLQGVKVGLQQRLSEQERSFLVMKAQLLRTGFGQQVVEDKKEELERKVSEQERLIIALKGELTKRHQELEELKAHFQIQHEQRANSTKNMKVQIQGLHKKLKNVGDAEASLSAKVASQDRKMTKLESKIMEAHEGGSRPSSARSTHSGSSDDLQLVRDSLQSLRSHFLVDDPQLHSIDILEQSISSLMDRLQMSEPHPHRKNGNHHRGHYDSTGDMTRSPVSSYPPQRLDSPVSNGHALTKILYFTDSTVTPFMVTLPKRLGEILLRDIKGLFDHPNGYRYHFKALDPEFGAVKEEITHDEDVIPGWEGKIVAWVEEDHG